MSFESSAIAMNHSRATGTARLVLLGIASHDGDGGAWPSVATLARYANVTPRNVQKAVERLVELGEVSRIIQGGGTRDTPDHSRPNRYEFTLRCPSVCDGTKRHRDRYATPIPTFQEGASVATPGVGSDGGGASEATPERPMNHPTRDKETALVRNAREGACGHALVPERPQYCVMGCSPAQVKREEAR